MDTSKQYKEMSEKAVEIQRNNEGVSGNHMKGNILLCTWKDVGSYYWFMDTFAEREDGEQYIESTKSIWLPRQDQLQEMAEYRSIGKNLELLSEFWNTKYCYDNFTTMEQLWLAFVMSEKYSKKWNGKEWRLECLVCNKKKK